MSVRRQEALDYHAPGRPGKIRVAALEVIGAEPGRHHVSGIYMLVFQQRTFCFADWAPSTC